MKIEVSDVDKQEMAHFLGELFQSMEGLTNEDAERVDKKLWSHGLSLQWVDYLDEYQVWPR